MNTHRCFSISLLLTFIFLLPQSGNTQSVPEIVCHKWKVVWYADDGEQKDMDDKDQYLTIRPDGSGEMRMQGEKVGDVEWSVAEGKNQIYFSDDPDADPYLVKLSKFKKGVNLLMTGTLPGGTERKVYFKKMAGRPTGS